MQVYVLVYDHELTRNQVKAKQLAHNSINGSDDASQLKQIYESIDDIQSKIESAIIPEDLKYDTQKIKSEDLAIALDFEYLSIAFLPNQKIEFDNVLALLHKDVTGDNLLIAELQSFEKFKKAATKISKRENIRNISAIIYRMIKIVREYYELKDQAQNSGQRESLA